ncbi:pancreas transcription factor 1 subunit alpha-like [Oscarella lobularis]|uniref:pancreas transcription factor 1 subunit alpha-like n=1 Tax=Oscarella lobularis TaxID=121494 RepID=UPI00331335C9
MTTSEEEMSAEREFLAAVRAARKRATWREHRRVSQLNEAFENLKRHLPFIPRDSRVSKKTIVELAIGYIHQLKCQLRRDDGEEGDVEGRAESSPSSSQQLLAVPTTSGVPTWTPPLPAITTAFDCYTTTTAYRSSSSPQSDSLSCQCLGVEAVATTPPFPFAADDH